VIERYHNDRAAETTAAMMDAPTRSYSEAWTRKARAQGRAGDAVFVERGALRALGAEDLAADAAPGPGRKPALLPTEQRMVDRDAYVAFLEDQLKRVSDMVLQLDAKEADVARTMAAAEARCVEAAREARAEDGARLEARLIDAEARIARTERELREAEAARRAADDRLADLLDGRREPEPRERLAAVEEKASSACARVLELEKALHRALRVKVARPDDDDGASSLGDDVEAALRDATEEGVRCRAAAEAADRRCDALAELAERSEAAARDVAAAATRHADERSECVVAAIADLERDYGARLDALERRAVAASPRRAAAPGRAPSPPRAASPGRRAPSPPRGASPGRVHAIRAGGGPSPPHHDRLPADSLLGSSFPLSPETLETDAPAIHTMSEAESALDAARESARCAADDAVARAAAAEDEAAGLRARAAQLCAKLVDGGDAPLDDAPLDDAPLPLPRCRASDDDDGAAGAAGARPRSPPRSPAARPSPTRLAARRGSPTGFPAERSPSPRRAASSPSASPRRGASSPPRRGASSSPRRAASPASPLARGAASPASPASPAPRPASPRAASPARRAPEARALVRAGSPPPSSAARSASPERRAAPAAAARAAAPRRDGADVTRLAAARESRLRGDAPEPADEPPPLPPHLRAYGGDGDAPVSRRDLIAMIPRLFADDYAGEPAPRGAPPKKKAPRPKKRKPQQPKRKSPPPRADPRGAMAKAAARVAAANRRAAAGGPLGESWPSSVMHCGPNTRAWVPAIKVGTPRPSVSGVAGGTVSVGTGPGH